MQDHFTFLSLMKIMDSCATGLDGFPELILFPFPYFRYTCIIYHIYFQGSDSNDSTNLIMTSFYQTR